MEEMQEKQDLQTEDIQVAPTEQTFATEQDAPTEQTFATEQVVASEQDAPTEQTFATEQDAPSEQTVASEQDAPAETANAEELLLQEVSAVTDDLRQAKAENSTACGERFDVVDKRLDKIEAKLDNILALLHDLIANGGQLQSVAIAQEELAEVASEVAPVTAPEVAPITMIDTDQAEVAESDDVAKEPSNWLDRVENGFFKARLSFDMKMRLQSDEIKEYYSTVKNYLLSYGIKSRISQPKETFNRGRDQIARMAVNGKTLVIYLAIDPSTLDETYYHQRDCRDKKLVADVPTMIKIRSKLSVKKICDLLDVICEDLVIFRKPKYVETNFAEQLTLDGFSTVECKGFDYLVRPSVALEDMQYYNDRLANQLLEPVIATAPDVVDSVEISVDDIRQNFDEGELVDLDTLKQKGLCSAEKNALSIVESDFLDKKYSVFANAFTPNAVKMICLAGGQAYLLTESFEALNESDDEDDAQ